MGSRILGPFLGMSVEQVRIGPSRWGEPPLIV